MKNSIIIFNPHSGRGNHKIDHNKIKSIFLEYGYSVKIVYTEYKGHAKDIIKKIGYYDLVISIGGDGTFLSFVHKCKFPTAPIIGINTGHLGFFQEASPDHLEETIDEIDSGRIKIQNIKPVQARIVTTRNEFYRIGLNEILAVGTAREVDNLDLSDSIRVVGFDTNVECVEFMREGVVTALIAQNPYAMGYLGVEYAWKVLEGEHFDNDVWIDTSTTIINRRNMFSQENQQALFSFG